MVLRLTAPPDLAHARAVLGPKWRFRESFQSEAAGGPAQIFVATRWRYGTRDQISFRHDGRSGQWTFSAATEWQIGLILAGPMVWFMSLALVLVFVRTPPPLDLRAAAALLAWLVLMAASIVLFPKALRFRKAYESSVARDLRLRW